MVNARAEEAESALMSVTLSALSPERAYFAVAGACVAGALVVLPLSRPGTPGADTHTALAIEAALCLALAASHRLPDSRAVHAFRAAALFVVGLLAGIPGWFFGAFSGFAAVVVLGLMLAGTAAGGQRGHRSALTGWCTFAGLATGQALAFTLPFLGIIHDNSLVPVYYWFKEPRPNQVFSHLAMQAVFLGSFAGARAFQRKYRRLAEEVDVAERAAAVRGALLDEARADYMHALLAARSAAAAPHRGRSSLPSPVDDEVTRLDSEITRLASSDGAADAGALVSALRDATTAAAPPSTPSPPTREASVTMANDQAPGPLQAAGYQGGAEHRWQDAYRAKMRGQLVGVTVAAAFGCVVIARIAHYPNQIWVGCLSMAAVVALAWYQRALAERRRTEGVYWPWVVIGALSVGPTYAFGFNSSFAAVITALLFFGGLFRATQRPLGPNRRIVVLLALCSTHAVAFVLVYAGVLPDIGNVPVRMQGSTPQEPVVQHLLLQVVFGCTFLAGWLVDRHYDALMRRAAAAARNEARQEQMLQTTRAAIDRLQSEDGGGIFASQRVGRFELRSLRARGGMGDVYEAVEIASGRRVAVKIIRHDRAADPVILRLFVTEATALGRVHSPHVAEVLEVGGLEDQLPYVAMELIDGPTLSRVLRDRGRLDLEELRELVRDAACGLAAIHGAGIVHRDVKPQNLMRSASGPRPCWKIVDLGVAQTREQREAATSAEIVGTPPYMSPEQALGGDVDARSDLYSLCLVIYRALTGRPALTGRETSAKASGSGRRALPSPRAFMAVPADVELALRIGLASRPADRFATADELVAAFDQAFAGALEDGLRRHGRALLEREPWATHGAEALGVEASAPA